jgi:hypothetical protein
MEVVDGAGLLHRLRSPLGPESLTGLILVDPTTGTPTRADLALVASVPAVLAGLGPVDGAWLPALDLVVEHGDVEALRGAVHRNPLAAVTLAMLLRASEGRPTGAGLVAESAAYSTLQAGPEFARWRASRPARPVRSAQETVTVEREGDRLRLTLNRPDVRNAFNARMRDELLDALALARADPAITVELRGAGPAFCAGGDLDEFGSRADPASAHLVRLERSVARALDAISARVGAHLHGACYGSGIELPAFAGTVTADPDTVIALPEVGLGLVPGAGGTVSLVRRAGRHRVAWLGLLGRAIDVHTALEWGLVDRINL